MSSYATGWAWQQSVGKSKLLLLALADLADDRGETRTDVEVLAEMIDKDRSTVFRQLDHLADLGFIEREGAKAANHTQLVSVTRLLIRGRPAARPAHHAAPAQRRRQENAVLDTVAKCDPALENVVFEAVAKCDPAPEVPNSIPSQNATRPPAAPEEAASQNATRKEKHLYSLSKTISNNNTNTAGEGERESTHDEDVVVGAGLGELWNDWASASNANPVTLARQQAAWAKWVREGHADLLREAAGEVLDLGSYAHPQAGLVAKMKTGITAKAKNSARPGGAASGGHELPVFAEDQRVRYGEQEMTIVSISPNGTLVTDSDATPLIPPAFHTQVEVLS